MMVIKHNVANKQCNLISFLWKHPFSKFTNINISYNTSIDNKLLNKFNYLLKDVSPDYVPRIFINIYSEDPLSSNIYKDNVLNHSILSFSGKLEETDEYYNGEKVFLCKEGGQFFIWGNYSEINATIPYWNEMYNNKIIDFKYNIKTESYDWYKTGVTIELKNDTHEYQGLYISKNSKITLPIAYVIGEGDFRKESYNFKLYSSPGKYIYNVPGFTLKQNTITLIEGNDIFEGIDGNNKKLLKKSIYHGEIEDLNIPYDIRSIFKGVTVYSETNKNVLIYDGNSRWLSVNGDTPNAKGSESNKQNVIKKQNTLYYNTDTKKLEYYNGENFEAIQSSSKGLFNDKPINPQIGFAYFCTDKQTSEGSTDGIMIYHKGDNVWVDALGRVVV